MLTVTDVGLAAIANAQENGFLISLTAFAVSETDITYLNEDEKRSATGLAGIPVFTSDITSIEVVDTSAVKLTLTIPIYIPKDGSSLQLAELGIFLESGELFAYGPLSPVYEKTQEYAITISALVVAGRLGDVINVMVSQNNSLPATPYVRSLVPATQTYQNVVVVLDEQVNDYQDASTASLAIKTGPGGSQWGFVGYNRVYLGFIDSVANEQEFIILPETGGFWLNDEEIVIAQIVSGPGAGYSRKLKYSKSDSRFSTTDKAWATIATSSKIAIWRSVSNQLPSRLPDMPEYLVLGVGVNTWDQVVSNTLGKRYRMLFASGIVDSNNSFTDPILIGIPEAQCYVFVAGICQTYGTYTIADGALSLTDCADKAINVYVFSAYDAQDNATICKFETEAPSNGAIARFYFPIVPENTSWVEVYHNNKYVDKSLYTTEETSILFTIPPLAGTIRIVCFGLYEDKASYTSISRYVYTASAGSLTFDVATDSYETSRIIAYIGEEYFSEKDIVVVDEHTIQLKREPNFQTAVSLPVDITVFGISQAGVDVDEQGIDTGPVWVDPAGRLGPPNKLYPVTVSYVSDGIQVEYSIPKIPRKTNVIMVAGGAQQDLRNMNWIKGPALGKLDTLILADPMPPGVKIDFICFTDVADDGTAVACEVQNFFTTSSTSYEINPVENINAIMVFVGGAYQHKITYSVTNLTTLNLLFVVPGLEVEIWYFKTVPHSGWRTEMYVDFDTSNNVNSYPMSHQVTGENNTLLFVDSVYQYKNKYNVVTANSMQQVVFNANIEVKYTGLPMSNVYFISGPPLTRLLLREDGEMQYMPRFGPYVDWPNLSYRLRDMLACPLTKLLALFTGTMKMEFNQGSKGDQDLANKYGLQPVTKTLTMDVLPTAAYNGMGSGAVLGAKMKFNVYKYLEIYLKSELNSASFTIHTYEQGVKYFIDDIKLGELKYTAVARSEIPMITWATGIYVHYPYAYTGTTYPGVPLLTNFFDMVWSRDHSVLPSGFALTSYTKLKTVSITTEEDDSTQTRTFIHTIQNDFNGQTYVIKWKRPYVVPNHNVEYMTLVDGDNAPGYVQYFARLYAQWKYNDEDIVKCMYYNKVSSTIGGISDTAWPAWLVKVRAGNYGTYPASASYTAGLTFGVTVDNFDPETGTCDLSIKITSGTIGYSYFPAEILMKSILIPVTYTMYPAMSVKPDGTIDPMLSNEDLFTSCCWTDFTPSTSLDCGAGTGIVQTPTVNSLSTTETKPTISGTYPNDMAISLKVTMDGQSFVLGIDSALTASANMWVLDLAQTTITLSQSFYDVEVEVTLPDGSTKTDSTVNEVSFRSSSDTTPPPQPTVDEATFETLIPIITGTYPASDAAGGLSVSINGWAYSLGSTTVGDVTDPFNTRNLSSIALTASGSVWSLDLSKDPANVLSWSTYEVIATAVDAAGNIASDVTANEITLVAPVIKMDFIAIGGGSGGSGGGGDNGDGGNGGHAGGYQVKTIDITKGERVSLKIGVGGLGGTGQAADFNVMYASMYGAAGTRSYVVKPDGTEIVSGAGGAAQVGNAIGSGSCGNMAAPENSYYTTLTGVTTAGANNCSGTGNTGNHGGGGGGGGSPNTGYAGYGNGGKGGDGVIIIEYDSSLPQLNAPTATYSVVNNKHRYVFTSSADIVLLGVETTVEFDVAGANSWVAPDKALINEIIFIAGGGTGGSSHGKDRSAGGGGSGGYGKILSALLGSDRTIGFNIGAGGPADYAFDTQAPSGGNTTLTINGTTYTVYGGKGGWDPESSSGPAGGAAGAGYTGPGVAGSAGVASGGTTGGKGADSYYTTLTGIATGGTAVARTHGLAGNRGGGGSGAGAPSNTTDSYHGGKGGDGYVRITYAIPL